MLREGGLSASSLKPGMAANYVHMPHYRGRRTEFLCFQKPEQNVPKRMSHRYRILRPMSPYFGDLFLLLSSGCWLIMQVRCINSFILVFEAKQQHIKDHYCRGQTLCRKEFLVTSMSKELY